jgi:hypothetical protein
MELREPSYERTVTSFCVVFASALSYPGAVGKGWDRASFEMNTRPNRVERDVSRKNLMLPKGFGVKLFFECMACGLLVGIGFLWGPLTIVAIGLDGHAPWFWPVIGAVSLGLGLLMFFYVRSDVKDVLSELD